MAQPDGKSPLDVSFDMGFTLNYGRYFVRDKFGKIRLLREFKDAHSDTVYGVCFNAAGTMLASCAKSAPSYKIRG